MYPLSRGVVWPKQVNSMIVLVFHSTTTLYRLCRTACVRESGGEVAMITSKGIFLKKRKKKVLIIMKIMILGNIAPEPCDENYV